MDELGIAESAVYHMHAQQYDHNEGNSTLIKDVSGQQRLHPVLLVGPHHTGEVPNPEALYQFMRENNAWMLKMYFGVEPFVPGPDPFLLAPLLDLLSERRMILLLEYASRNVQHHWIREILEGWPGVRIVLMVPKIEYEARYLYALWERFDSFFFELTGNQFVGGIESVVERFGAERMVYGSRYP